MATIVTSTEAGLTAAKPERLPTTVSKPTNYTYDLSHLCAVDPNPLPHSRKLLSQPQAERNEVLKIYARDGAQSLLNTLLTTCAINSTSDALLMTLPSAEPQNKTPRWKPLPKPKAPSKWELYARKKGIGKFGGNLKGGAALEDRRKNLVFDEEKGEWVKKWGHKNAANKGTQNDWLVELDEKQSKKESQLGKGMTIRGEQKRERMERMRRQERKERNNVRAQRTKI